MSEPSILFDLDDTLGGVRMPDGRVRGTAAAYFDCIARAVTVAEQRGLDPELFREHADEVDKKMARELGFGDKTRFAKSLAWAYADLTEQQDPFGEDTIYDIGMSVFTDYPYAALPGAVRVLEALHDHYRIHIVTKGDHDEQHRKVTECGFEELVDVTLVCSHKNDDEWQQVLPQLGFCWRPNGEVFLAHESWAVGNSPKSDVNPLIRLGFNGIHVVAADTWSFEEAALETPRGTSRLHAVTHIEDVLRHIPTNH